MRQIKLRAWHFKKQRMFESHELVRDQMTLLADGRFINVSGVDTRLSIIFALTVLLPLQYTGKKDTNGVEICEGDVVNFTYWWFDGNEAETLLTGHIVYSDENMSFQLKGVKNKEWERHTGYENDQNYLTPFSELNFEDADFEVIGNIYENPELLAQ